MSGVLLGPTGKPISTSDYKKAPAPALGPSFGDWAGRDVLYNQMPGGAILQFDLSMLTLADFRAMRYHPQLNASLSVLTFMLHQVDWHLECDDKKIEREGRAMFEPLWTRLVRGMSQSFWAGYSPIAIEYENNIQDRRVDISKFKDLIPEDCSVKWKAVEGALNPETNRPSSVKPKLKVFDGIHQFGMPDIPTEHSLWYPLLMENGDYTGRKLLKAAFSPWYFSILVHLFANRYYERFGEPVPIGRAPFDEEYPDSDAGGAPITGKQAMEVMLANLRNRGAVTLPNTLQSTGFTQTGARAGRPAYEYDIEYLESQMRGADFERYLSRLDEEMSLALFTPLLLLRNADVGSHNLGVQHTQTWLWMLNALTGDMKEYIDRYPLSRWVDFNYGPNAKRLRWVPHKLGKQNTDMLRAVITSLVSGGLVKVDLEELGQALGLTLTEIKQVTEPPTDPNKPDQRVQDKSSGPNGVGEPRATGKQISNRVRKQVEAAFKKNQFGSSVKLDLGYHNRFLSSLRAEGFTAEQAQKRTTDFFSLTDNWLSTVMPLADSDFDSPNDFMSLFDRMLDQTIDQICAA
jgi:hypothetical protein